MGLDMYLNRKSDIGGTFDRATMTYTTGVKVEGLPLLPPKEGNSSKDCGRVTEISEEAAYWRKANQIHNWFVENVQEGEDDCGNYTVSTEQLQELVDTCRKVWADHRLAEGLLPTASGFFFGGTDYDEWYYQDLTDTVEQLEPLLEFEAQNEVEGIYTHYEYHSSW